MLDGKAGVPERMNVDIANVIRSRYMLDPDDWLRHVSSTADDRLLRLQSRARNAGTGAGRIPLFGDDHLVVLLQFAFDNLGEIVVVESGCRPERTPACRREAPKRGPDPLRELRCRLGI